MNNVITSCSKIILMIFSICVFTNYLSAQQTGTFEKSISIGSGNRNIAFSVPGSAPAKGYPVIIGMHPAQTPETIMRDMLQSSADDLNAILACPEGPDGDGAAIMPLVNYIKKTYKVDSTKIILTGYSAGGHPTFDVGLANVSVFKGLIGIAPATSSSSINTAAALDICIAVIVGKGDGMYSDIKAIMDMLKAAGGTTKFVEKAGVGHTGDYFWGPDFTTDWKACYDFCVKTVIKPKQTILSEPMNDATDQTIPCILKWDATANATSYKIEISTSKGVFKSDVSTKTTYTPTGLQKKTKYTWKVCAVNSGGDGPWSDSWSFTTVADAPKTASVLMQPAKDTTIEDGYFTFVWKKVDDATFYHFKIFNKSNSELLEEDSTLVEENGFVSYLVPNLQNGNEYKWKVRAYNAAGSAPWSEEWSFSVGRKAPTLQASLVTPADKAQNQPVSLKFKWIVVKDADFYQLQIKNVSSGNMVFNNETIYGETGEDSVSVDVTDFKYETEYSWKVKARNSTGDGPWSQEYTFKTQANPNLVEEITNSDISVYPNPSDGKIELDLSAFTGKTVNISLNLINGNMISMIKSDYQVKENKIKLDLSGFPNGIYLLKINGHNIVNLKKLIIEK